MKSFVMSICLLLCLSSYSNAQEVRFRVIKPLSVVRNSVVFVGKTTEKILHGARKILTAPFTTPVPKPEVKEYKCKTNLS